MLLIKSSTSIFVVLKIGVLTNVETKVSITTIAIILLGLTLFFAFTPSAN